MEQSLAYAFILNMWKMNRVDEAFVNGQVKLNRLTQDEADAILLVSQS